MCFVIIRVYFLPIFLLEDDPQSKQIEKGQTDDTESDSPHANQGK